MANGTIMEVISSETAIEEREKDDESIKAADDYYGVLMSYYMNGIEKVLPKVKQGVAIIKVWKLPKK